MRNVEADPAGYVAVVFNRGREAAGAFDVGFVRDGEPLGSARVAGLEPQTRASTCSCPARGARRATPLEAVVDPLLRGRRVQRVQRLRQRVLLSQSATASQ